MNVRHEVVRVSRNSGDFRVDIADPGSIERLYGQTGAFDALVNTAGNVHFGPFEQFTPEQFEVGLRDKLMGQVNLVTLGLKHIVTAAPSLSPAAFSAMIRSRGRIGRLGQWRH